MNNEETTYSENLKNVSRSSSSNAQHQAEPLKADTSYELEIDQDGNVRKRAAMLGAAVVGGSLIGGGASYLAGANIDAHDPAVVSAGENSLQVTDEPDSMDFESAFNDARLTMGPGAVFRWHGGLYGTYTKEEWDNMSDAERDAYEAKVSGMAQGSERYAETYSHNQYITNNYHVEVKQDEPAPKPAPAPAEDEYKIVSEEKMEISGHPVVAAHATHNGHDCVLIDVDKDGVYDKVVEDVNGNGAVDEGDIKDIGQMKIHVQDTSLLEDLSDSDHVEVIVGDDETVTTINGHQAIINTASVEGHRALIVDINQDGTYDYAAVDANDNGEWDENDVRIQITSENVRVKDPHLIDVAQTDQDLDRPGANLPDYVNTASAHNDASHDYAYQNVDGAADDTAEMHVDGADDEYAYQNVDGGSDEYAYQNPDENLPEDAIAADESEADMSHDFAMDDPAMNHDGFDPSADIYDDGSANI